MPRRCKEHPGWDEDACVWCNGAQSYNLCHRDQLYNFRWWHKNERHDIYSKRQFSRLCKERGLVPATRDDFLSHGSPYRPKPRTVNREQVSKIVADVKAQMTPEKVECVWQQTQEQRR